MTSFTELHVQHSLPLEIWTTPLKVTTPLIRPVPPLSSRQTTPGELRITRRDPAIRYDGKKRHSWIFRLNVHATSDVHRATIRHRQSAFSVATLLNRYNIFFYIEDFGSSTSVDQILEK